MLSHKCVATCRANTPLPLFNIIIWSSSLHIQKYMLSIIAYKCMHSQDWKKGNCTNSTTHNAKRRWWGDIKYYQKKGGRGPRWEKFSQ